MATLFLDVIQSRNGLEVSYSFRVITQHLKPHRSCLVGAVGDDLGFIPLLAQSFDRTVYRASIYVFKFY
jgi:hypothetical protein